jgi:predicted Zn-dependent protease
MHARRPVGIILALALPLAPGARAAGKPAKSSASSKAKAEELRKAGLAAEDGGKDDEALAHFEQVLKVIPDDEVAHAELGKILFKQGKGPEAIGHLQTAVKLKPDDATAWYNLAYASKKERNFSQAADAYQKYTKLQPDDLDGVYGLADSLRQADRPAEATEAYQSYIAREKRPTEQKYVEKSKERIAELSKQVADKAAAEKAATEKAAADKLAAEQAAAAKIVADKLAAEKAASDKLAADKAAFEKVAADKLAAEQAATAKREADKLAADKLSADKATAAAALAAEKQAAANKIAAEKQAAADKIAAEKAAAADKIAAEKAAAARAALEKADAEAFAKKSASEQAAIAKLAAEKAAADKTAAEKEAAAKVAFDKAAADKLVADQAAAKLAADKAAQSSAAKIATDKAVSDKANYKKLSDEAAADKAAADALSAEHEKVVADKAAQTAAVQGHTAAAPHIKQGDKEFAAKKYRDALFAYQDAMQSDPRSVEALLKAGDSYSKLGYGDEAIEHWNRALALDPSNQAAKDSLAAYKARRAGEAAPAVAQQGAIAPSAPTTVKITPVAQPPAAPSAMEVAKVHYVAGVGLVRERKFDAAIAELDQAVAARPNFAVALIARGSAKIGLSRFQEAIDDYSAARSADGALAAPIFGIAEGYRGLGQNEKAAEFYRAFAASTAPDAQAQLKQYALQYAQSLAPK